jgi:hypothetical protein
MNELTRDKLKEINGGGLNAPMVNAIARGTQLVYNIGVQFGTAIRYLLKGKSCR